jgi:hypothetical protein
VKLGVVRAHFEPPAPGIPDDAGGAVTVSSAMLADSLCEVRDYNHLFVADLDGDERLEMYLDITTSTEKLNREGAIRSGPDLASIGHRFERHLYLFAGDGGNGFALSLGLGDWEDRDPPFQELVELRDVNRDRRLDVIQKELCFDIAAGRSANADTCDGRARRKTVYVYDAQKDEWAPMQDAKDDGAKEPASDGAKEPAKEPAAGAAKEPAAGAAKEHAKDGTATEPASGAAAPP